ncbi:hypothetical protein Belba_0966 [Belliella baltica DSM 15883]|uniref:Uncharacterized protein n=1 Tax=Belliella baltica (strain DSM 15883 / CIP 108006 / LMG 21964 / BA134) TaxID=866536 RepID=I3Z2Z1_BELBD|nr:hypothetical protein [Belliella baltica]AFL83609.1 hypothetical protein Belba_0966 [Belliella baltica DSM 15883]
METLLKKVPLLAFMVAAVFAFAFTQPNHAPIFAFNPMTQQWDNLTELEFELGTDYICNESSNVCTASYTNDDPENENPIPATVVDGDYIRLTSQ